MKTIKELVGAEWPWLIAEIGVNHDGSSAQALQLVEMAARCGCQAVKFQYFKADRLASAKAPLADYQQRSAVAESQHAMLKRLEIELETLNACRNLAAERQLAFGCTPFDEISLGEITQLKPDFIKIGSGDADNLPLLEAARDTGLPVIVSFGMSTLKEVERVVSLFDDKQDQLALLHCVSSYPAPEDECNLRVLARMQATGCVTGFSDHTPGSLAAQLALACGAVILEKHVTHSRLASGPDHACSLEEVEMVSYVHQLSHAGRILGDGIKRVMPCEENVRQVARKSLVARHPLPAGHVIAESDLICLRPAGGITPWHRKELVGMCLGRPVEAGEFLGREHFVEEMRP
jgi:N,N'-diacetyllegionaminate synthase